MSRLTHQPACAGAQYLIDVEEWSYRDARLQPEGTLTPDQLALWKKAIWKG